MGPPNGDVNVTDMLAIVRAFVGSPTAIRKARADLEPGIPDQLVNFTDVLSAVFGFTGVQYSFMVCNPNTDKCVGGPNHGQDCTDDTDCRVPLCPSSNGRGSRGVAMGR